MASKVVGLDIGSFAVRAAELTVQGSNVTVTRFGQVTLPPDAVRDGEVADIPAVSAALRRLWAEAGFKDRKVAVGVANQRVIVRQAEVAAMSEADLGEALKFEAQELIPIPVDDAILDFRIVDRFTDGAGEERMHILLAAAQRDMVRSHLAAVEGAGLTTERVDAVPFALIRALDPRQPSNPDGPTGAEAIVCVGGAVTSIVVHENGVPRFMRVLLVGGDDLTQAVANELSVDRAQAEDLKRRAAYGGGDTQVLQASNVVSTRLSPLVDEIRGSLDYYLAQPDASPIQRVMVTGGGSRVLGLVERLEHQLRMEVQVARPLAPLKVGDLGLSPQQLEAAESVMAVPIGLALPDLATLDGTRRINLMPGDLAAAKAQRRQLVLAGMAAGAFAVLLGLTWAARQTQVKAEERRVEETEAAVANLQRQVASLSDMAQLETDLKARRTVVDGSVRGEFAWTRLIRDVSSTLPSEVYMTSLSMQSAAGAGTATISFELTGRGHQSAASWMETVGRMPALTKVWVPSVQVGEDGSATFSSSGVVAPTMLSDRAQKAGAAPARSPRTPAAGGGA